MLEVSFSFFARSSAIFTYLSGAARRVGLHAYEGGGPWRGDLLTHRLNYNPYIHTGDLFRLFIGALDEPADRFPAFPATPPAAEDPTVRPPAAAEEEACPSDWCTRSAEAEDGQSQ